MWLERFTVQKKFIVNGAEIVIDCGGIYCNEIILHNVATANNNLMVEAVVNKAKLTSTMKLKFLGFKIIDSKVSETKLILEE